MSDREAVDSAVALMSLLADNARKSGNAEDAAALYRSLRLIRADSEGKESDMYLSNLHSEVYARNDMGEYAKAVSLAQELLDTRTLVYGADHDLTIDAARWLGWVQAKSEDYESAVSAYFRAAESLASAGETVASKKALSAALYYETKAGVLGRVANLAEESPNREVLRKSAKRLGGIIGVAAVSATVEGLVGNFIFDS